jgi:peptide/nickel transport system substrate-binding protein
MIMTKKRRMVLLMAACGLVIGVAGTLLVSCGNRPAGERASGLSTCTIADSTGDWGYPTPYGMYPRGPGYIRMSFIFDTLLWKNRDGLSGALAEGWDYHEQDNSYQFTLRPNLKWHDGQDLTSEDIAFTFAYVREHPWPWMQSGVVEEAVAVDARTVRVGLSRPYAPFLTNVAGTLPILPRHVWREVQDPETFRDEKALTGSGPYRLVDYDPAHGSYLYAAWDGYYLGKPQMDRIRFVKYSEEMTPTALRTGKVDAGSVPPEAVDGLKETALQVMSQPPVWAAKLMINHDKPGLSERKLRRALAYAIDRERLVRIVRRGHAIPGSPGLIPPTSERWHNPDVAQYEHDVKKTAELLRELGYARDEDGMFARDGERLEFELLVAPERQEFGRLAEMLRGQLAEAGIAVTIRSAEAKTLDSMLQKGRFELALSGHGGLGGDPEILSKMITGESFNSARYRKNEDLVALLRKQLRQTDRNKRRQTVFRVQEIYAEEVPAVTLYHPTWYWAHDGSADLYYTPGGVALGIPIPLNKWSFVRVEGEDAP